jgi:hypothetical protein
MAVFERLNHAARPITPVLAAGKEKRDPKLAAKEIPDVVMEGKVSEWLD